MHIPICLHTIIFLMHIQGEMLTFTQQFHYYKKLCWCDPMISELNVNP